MCCGSRVPAIACVILPKVADLEDQQQEKLGVKNNPLEKLMNYQFILYLP
jgi:hypothetical protein